MPYHTADEFIAKIIEMPGDDTPRLAYADWLSENGDDDRGDFIQAQVKLSKWKDGEHCPECGLHWRFGQSGLDGGKGSIYHCNNDHTWHQVDHADLQQRERELLAAHFGDWITIPGWELLNTLTSGGAEFWGPNTAPNAMKVNAHINRIEFVRGFVESVRCPVMTWMGETCFCRGRAWDQPDPCHRCHGSGRTGGIAKAVCGSHPITACAPTDRKPYHVVSSDFWRWWCFRNESEALPEYIPSLLPEVLYEPLRKMHPFASAELANAALSAVLVQWGKKSANHGGIE